MLVLSWSVLLVGVPGSLVRLVMNTGRDYYIYRVAWKNDKLSCMLLLRMCLCALGTLTECREEDIDKVNQQG